MPGHEQAVLSLTIVFLLVLAVFPDATQAGDVSWKNPVSGNWNDPTKWDTDIVPGPSDNVFITVDGTYTVTLNVNATVASLTVGASSGEQTLFIGGPTLTLNGASIINSNGILYLTGGMLTGAGDLSFNSLFSWSGGSMNSTGKTFVNGGTLITTYLVFLDGRTLDGHHRLWQTVQCSTTWPPGTVWCLSTWPPGRSTSPRTGQANLSIMGTRR